MLERAVLKRIQLGLSKAGAVMFRNNVGLFCDHASVKRAIHLLDCGMISQAKRVLMEARPVMTGLIKGASDEIGWTPTVITPDMVGQTVAVFTAVEVKTDTGRPSKEQLQFIDRLKRDGGYAGIARTEDDIPGIIGR